MAIKKDEKLDIEKIAKAIDKNKANSQYILRTMEKEYASSKIIKSIRKKAIANNMAFFNKVTKNILSDI